MRIVLFAALLVLVFFDSAQSQQLYLNEFMASNNKTIADATGKYEDWFEIYNPNSFTVDIAGYYVTNNLTTPTKYKLQSGSGQTVIPANGYLLLWASGAPGRGATHVNFKLAQEGEQLGLYRPDGSTVVDTLTFGAQRTDISRGRQPDGSTTFRYFRNTASQTNVTPGASNNSATGYAESMSAPVFSTKAGFYTDAFSLTLTAADPTATIYYTLDGSDPDPANLNGTQFSYKNTYVSEPGQTDGSLLSETFRTNSYTGSLTIADRSADTNRLANKSSTYYNPATYKPTSSIFKGTVVRAIVTKPDAIPSDVITQSYFVTPANRYYVPVVSIATNEQSFFDYTTGIYTAGTTFDAWRATSPLTPAGYCAPGNFKQTGNDWQRAGTTEFFLNDTTILNQSVGLRINGVCTRTTPRKALRLNGDSNFQYPFFSNRPANQFYNRLLLRNGGNDWNFSLIIDAYAQTLARKLNLETQSNRPAIAFVNGEYWGIHSLYERYDRYYLNRNFNVSPDSVDIVEIGTPHGPFEADEGDLTSFNSLTAYFSQHDTVNYSYVGTQMDVRSFADYQITEIYTSNVDWPFNNVQLWRKRTSQYVPNAPLGQDGRWRWMLKDLDLSMSYGGGYANNTLANATDTTGYTLFLRRLLNVPEFKSYFINRYADLLNTTLDSTRLSDLLTSMKQAYQPYIPEHTARWANDITPESWAANVETIRAFVRQRPAYARNHLRAKFGLGDNHSIAVDVSNTSQGYVVVNTIPILPTTDGVSNLPYPWTGIYFQGNAIRVVAKAKTGYIFQYWKEGNVIVSTDTAYSFDPAADRLLTAVFGLNAPARNPTAYNLPTCAYRFTNWPVSSPAGTYPANMLFVQMNQEDPQLTATISGTVTGAYSYTSRTRINGLNDNGFSFVNTSGTSTNPGYVSNTLGGALLALQTTGLTQAAVQWTGGTVTPNSRQYRIRLRYRVGNAGDFTDLLDAANKPVEYVRNATAGHSQVIGPVNLPDNLLNQSYVQLLWQYYWTGVGTSGARDELRLDEIIITRNGCASLTSGNWEDAATWSCGRAPTACDVVQISASHSVTVSIPNAIAQRLLIGLNSRLIYVGSSARLTLKPTAQ